MKSLDLKITRRHFLSSVVAVGAMYLLPIEALKTISPYGKDANELQIGNAFDLRRGSLLRNERTGEIMLVTGIKGATVSFTRGARGTTSKVSARRGELLRVYGKNGDEEEI